MLRHSRLFNGFCLVLLCWCSTALAFISDKWEFAISGVLSPFSEIDRYKDVKFGLPSTVAADLKYKFDNNLRLGLTVGTFIGLDKMLLPFKDRIRVDVEQGLKRHDTYDMCYDALPQHQALAAVDNMSIHMYYANVMVGYNAMVNDRVSFLPYVKLKTFWLFYNAKELYESLEASERFGNDVGVSSRSLLSALNVGNADNDRGQGFFALPLILIGTKFNFGVNEKLSIYIDGAVSPGAIFTLANLFNKVESESGFARSGLLHTYSLDVGLMYNVPNSLIKGVGVDVGIIGSVILPRMLTVGATIAF